MRVFVYKATYQLYKTCTKRYYSCVRLLLCIKYKYIVVTIEIKLELLMFFMFAINLPHLKRIVSSSAADQTSLNYVQII